MPATVLPVTTITNAGVTVPLAGAETVADAVNGMVLSTNNGATTFILVTNTSAATKTVTAITPYTVAGLAIADQVYNLPATNGARMIMGPFDLSVYSATVNLTFSAATMTVLAFQI